MAKKKPKPSPGAQINIDTSGRGALGTAQTGSGPVYIGVDSGSDLEKYGYQGPGYGLVNPGFLGLAGGPVKNYYGTRKPLYKVGYQNSKTFARELNNMDPNVVYLYQQRMEAAGLLESGSYAPGKLDSATRAAFKQLLGTANQTATSWQQTLQDIESVGGLPGKQKQKQQPDAFVANLDDPATLRSAFQQVAQQLYGGDLPDSEVQSMVDAYRSQQMSKQKAAYDAQLAAANGGTPGQVDQETTPGAFAQQQLQQSHPDQLARVKFSDTLGSILDTLRSSPAGGA